MCSSNLSSGYVEGCSIPPLHPLERAFLACRSFATARGPSLLHVPEHEEWVNFSCGDKYHPPVFCQVLHWLPIYQEDRHVLGRRCQWPCRNYASGRWFPGLLCLSVLPYPSHNLSKLLSYAQSYQGTSLQR